MKNTGSLYDKALEVVSPRQLSTYAGCGSVGSALMTEKGEIYTGINIDCPCGLGFCAEHSAVAEMLKNGESRVSEIIAVDSKAAILPPCGRCRELLMQINPSNRDTLVHLSKTGRKKLSELLPDHWQQQ